MAGEEGWGLKAWFEDKEEKDKKGKTKKVEGYVVALKRELQERLDGKGTAAYKATPTEKHLERMNYAETKAMKVLQKMAWKEEDKQFFFEFYSKPQRERKGDDWNDKAEQKWDKLAEDLDEFEHIEMKAWTDLYNQAAKWVPVDGSLKEVNDPHNRDLSWCDEMIGYCDKMIELINKQDPTFVTNGLRNR